MVAVAPGRSRPHAPRPAKGPRASALRQGAYTESAHTGYSSTRCATRLRIWHAGSLRRLANSARHATFAAVERIQSTTVSQSADLGRNLRVILNKLRLNGLRAAVLLLVAFGSASPMRRRLGAHLVSRALGSRLLGGGSATPSPGFVRANEGRNGGVGGTAGGFLLQACQNIRDTNEMRISWSLRLQPKHCYKSSTL
eukprot:356959-Chlamydomonas_euryale.AAC.2